MLIAACAIAHASSCSRHESAKPESSESHSDRDSELAVAEAFVDAFYSWDADALVAAMDAPEDSDRALYYQRWAEAGNYQIQRRQPCVRNGSGEIECDITVVDDIGAALGYVATDTFRLRVEDGRVVRVEFASDDPPVFEALFEWMSRDRPEVFSGPCKDLFAGGKTPEACVRAVIDAARDFANRAPDER